MLSSDEVLRIVPRTALPKVAISLALGIAVALLALRSHAAPVAFLVGWNAWSLAQLTFAWIPIHCSGSIETHRRAAAEDPGRNMVYGLIVIASVVSLFAAAFLARMAHKVAPSEEGALIALCLATVALAWSLTHTAFTVRYAHLYYREDDEGIGGVSFPGCGQHDPTYFDFAYLAFTVGMCFQVSDMAITSSPMRRTVLLHGLISFAYNTAILAFALNLAFSVGAQ